MTSNESMDLFARQELEAKQRKKAELIRREIEKAIVDVMSTKQGRTVVAWMLAQTGLKNSVSSTDPIAMALASGKRDVGILISNAIEALCPQSFAQMHEEERTWTKQLTKA